MSESDKYAPIPLTIRRDSKDGTYKVHLGELDLSYALSHDGLAFEFEPDSGCTPPQPTVTLRFAPDALTVDVEAALVEYIRWQDGTLGPETA